MKRTYYGMVHERTPHERRQEHWRAVLQHTAGLASETDRRYEYSKHSVIRKGGLWALGGFSNSELTSGLVPFLGTGLVLYCRNRAGVMPVLGTGLVLYCRNRAGLMPVLGTGLVLYYRNRAGLTAQPIRDRRTGRRPGPGQVAVRVPRLHSLTWQ